VIVLTPISESQVSDHPEGRFAAAGPLAEALVRDVPWDDYYGPGSPLERFLTREGQVLRLGADRDTVTLLHYAEFLAPVARKRRVRRHRMTAEGVRAVETLDDEHGITDYIAGRDYFADLLTEFLTSSPHRAGRVGDARAELIDAGALVRFGVGWMGAHLAPFAR
jgi:aminoglycoside 3-N-acetyltransferase